MFWERYSALCEIKGSKPNPIGKIIGVASSTIAQWKQGTIPSGDTLLKIATYFDCSVDYLLGRTDNPAAHKQAPPAIFSNNSDVKGGIGNNSRISFGGGAAESGDEQLNEMIRLYSGLSPRKKAELMILIDDFVSENKE